MFAFYRIVLRGKASYTVSRVYLLLLPVVSLIMSVLTFEVYPSGTEIAIERIEPAAATFESEPSAIAVTVPTVAPAPTIAPAPQSVAASEPAKTEHTIVIDWYATLQWVIPTVSLLLLLIAVFYICKVLAIKSKMEVETTAEGYSLIHSKKIDTPFSFGKTIFLPQELNKQSESMIIRHEKAHIAHRHYADVWFSELLTRLFWFNPFVWLCRAELRNVHEFQADHDVVQSNVDISAYQTTLLEMVMNVSSPVVNGFNHSFIRRRFVEMKKTTVGTLGRVAKIGTIAWIGIMFCAFTFTEKKAEPNTVTTETAAQTSNENFVAQMKLMECSWMVFKSHTLTKSWVFIDKVPDTPDKLALKEIHNERFPKMQSELLEISKKWNDANRKELESIFSFINDTLFAYQKNIMERLKTLTDYEDMFVAMYAEMMVEEGGDETNAANEVNARIDALIKEIRTAATTQTTTERTVFQTPGPGKFVIEGAVDPGITDSCYLFYFADDNFEIVETPVACVPVVDKKFHYEVELNDLTVCRIRCIFPGGEICSNWIETFAAPGVTFELTVHNGYYSSSSQNSNYLSKVRRLANAYCKNHHLDENVAKPDGLYKTWENVKYGNWNNQKVMKVDFCEKKTVVTLSTSRWDSPISILTSDVCLRDTAGNLYKMLRNESDGNRYIDYICGARYAFEPLSKGVTQFDIVQKVNKKVSFFNENGESQEFDIADYNINVIVADIAENLNANRKPNFTITFKTKLTDEVTGFEIVQTLTDERRSQDRPLGEVDLDANGEATFSTYLEEPIFAYVFPAFTDARKPKSYSMLFPLIPGEKAEFTLTSSGSVEDDRVTGVTKIEIPKHELTGSGFYKYWNESDKELSKIANGNANDFEKAQSLMREYIKRHNDNLGCVLPYVLHWRADYSVLSKKILQHPMVKQMKERDDVIKQRDDEREKIRKEFVRQEAERIAKTRPGNMFTDFDLARHKFSEYVGQNKYVMVYFYYRPDTTTLVAIEKMWQKYKEKNFNAIGIDMVIHKPEYFRNLYEKLGVGFTQMMDHNHTAAHTYEIDDAGEAILFGPDGTILKRDIAANDIEKVVDEALNGKTSATQGSTTGISPQDDKYKAMHIYNFTKHVEWPATKGDFVVCVLGKTEVLSQLKAITNGKTVNGKPIKVIGVNNVGDIPNCQILYVPTSETSNLKSAIEKVGNAATLIVSNCQGALENGSCINIVEIDEKIKYEVNQKAIENRNLKINPNLLNMSVNK